VRCGTFKTLRIAEDGYEQVLGFAGRAEVLGFAGVLAVHQFFEGVSLGSVIADLGPSAPYERKLALAAAFSATTPLGVLLGGVPGGGPGGPSPRAAELLTHPFGAAAVEEAYANWVARRAAMRPLPQRPVAAAQ
jgi:hypothetical protein